MEKTASKSWKRSKVFCFMTVSWPNVSLCNLCNYNARLKKKAESLGEGYIRGRAVDGCWLSSMHNLVIGFVGSSYVWGTENASITKINLWKRFCPQTFRQAAADPLLAVLISSFVSFAVCLALSFARSSYVSPYGHS